MSQVEQMPEGGRIPAVWVGVDEMTVGLATTFTVQFQDDAWFLTFGSLVPPLLLGSPEEQQRQLEQIDFVPITPLRELG
jgi:hypothetical protein